jgi:molybdopterin-biosynthesis enzyme MoeA-like protein
MKATIVTIGDEILIEIVDTNSAFAKSLDRIGVEINEMISITKSHIVDTFEKLQNTVDWLLSLAVWVQLR